MSSSEETLLIVAYWFRKLITFDISIQHISKIIMEFSKLYDRFDELLSDPSLTIQDNGTLVLKTIEEGDFDYNDRSAFGTVTTITGKKHHWRLKIFEISSINLGIIEADKHVNNQDVAWWCYCYGYSYWSGNGQTYHDGNRNAYGTCYGKHDIIDMWLDLTQNKGQLFFAKNDEKFGKAFDVKESRDYRLAIAMYGSPNKLELLSFDIC